MATFISISGPSTTGKTSLIDSLTTYPELRHLKYGPDIHDKVWSELVEMGLFTDFTEISTDSSFMCTYIIRVADYYNKYIESFKDTEDIVILDGCWMDLSIYAMLYMWYTRIIKSVQEDVLHRLAKYDEAISRIYITKADDKAYPVDRFRLRGKMSTFRENRPLELRYYEIAKHIKSTVALPSSDIAECSIFIRDDLKNLGYL